MKTVLITGGSGLVGRRLTQLLKEKGYEVIWLSRDRHVRGETPRYRWDYRIGEIDTEAIDRADIIVHLAGAGVGDRRWSVARKNTIVNSRVLTAKLLFDTIKERGKKIEAFISASAIGYYGNKTTDRIFTEEDILNEPDFLATTCRQWEEAAQPFEEVLDIRTVIVRTGFVISKNSEALKKMVIPTKMGLGSPIGSGRQYMSWIQLNDLCGIYLKAIEDESMRGIYNAVAPEYISNRSFMRRLARTLRRPFFMPNIPSFVMKLVMGESAGLILGGSRISSDKVVAAGYDFKYKSTKKALRASVDAIKREEKKLRR